MSWRDAAIARHARKRQRQNDDEEREAKKELRERRAAENRHARIRQTEKDETRVARVANKAGALQVQTEGRTAAARAYGGGGGDPATTHALRAIGYNPAINLHPPVRHVLRNADLVGNISSFLPFTVAEHMTALGR